MAENDEKEGKREETPPEKKEEPNPSEFKEAIKAVVYEVLTEKLKKIEDTINLALSDLSRDNLAKRVSEIIKKQKVDPHNVVDALRIDSVALDYLARALAPELVKYVEKELYNKLK